MELSLAIAFAAGVVSFLSPCILPIVPGFLAYLAGTSVAGTPTRRATFLNALCFVLGFSLVFAILGILLQTALSHLAYDARIWLSRIGGVIVIGFGLYLAGVLRIPWLEREHQMRVNPSAQRNRYLTSALFGAAFAAGWTPCVGAALGAILTLAAVNAGSAFWLLMAYSLGLGMPFLLVGLFASSAQGIINRHAAGMATVAKVFGWVLVVMGILVFTQRLERIANFGFVRDLLTP
jgi:cytochrome c-type biogenesis protein